MNIIQPVVTGLAGAVTVTLLNEGTRRFVPNAPRLDKLGKQAIRRALPKLGLEPPKGLALFATAMAGDLLANTLYYGLTAVGKPRHPIMRGIALGAAAGVGVLVLPQRIGLGRKPASRTLATKGMAFGWYLLAGLAAAALANRASQR